MEASVAKRYIHVPTEVILSIAGQVEGLLWKATSGSAKAPAATLTDDQRQALGRRAHTADRKGRSAGGALLWRDTCECDHEFKRLAGLSVQGHTASLAAVAVVGAAGARDDSLLVGAGAAIG